MLIVLRSRGYGVGRYKSTFRCCFESFAKVEIMSPRHFHFKSSCRRRGQALLLAVLVMVFIVLLGTTFIAIVSSSISQTARTSSKDQARQSAQAGIVFAEEELTGSGNGLDWRPDDLGITNVHPLYNFYWTSFDRAQGWDQPFYTLQNGLAAKAAFVKYPNPLTHSPSGKASHFMIRVSQVQGYPNAPDPDNLDNTKTGNIRIESIGLANDDPAAFYKVVAYKQGLAGHPLMVAMRSVTNWDFNNSVVPQGRVASSSITSITLTEVKGFFDNNKCPFYITIGDPATNSVASALVSGVTNNGTTLTLSSALSAAPVTGTLVQKAAGLGAPPIIKFDNVTDVPVDYRISGINNPFGNFHNTPGSVWVNGGLVWFGSTNANNLIAPSATTPGNNIQASGLFTSTIAPIHITGTGVATSTAAPISSADSNFSTNQTVVNKLVDDGWNRLAGVTSASRQVRDFIPPDITTGGDGFGRYRQLTRYSEPNTLYAGATNISSAYGYGKGIYINNSQDVEKIGSAIMTQTQLHDLWFGTGTGNPYNRLGTPDAPSGKLTVTANSLEGQHMRGWVSPEQFLPRGAEVIINSNNTITVNLDPVGDNTAEFPNANFTSSAITVDPNKSWRNVSGNLMGDGAAGSNTGGVYSQTFYWPANGTVFAEGNIRIRGSNPNASNSLTVVSMNNIYIEGSLSAGAKKVLLLARKNVIINPTQVLKTVQAATRLSAPTVGGTSAIYVYDASNFRAGDYVRIAGGTNIYGIKSISGNTINLNTKLAATSRPATSIVYTVFDPTADVGSYTTTYNGRPYISALRLSRSSNVIQRRVQWPGTGANLRLAFRHSAEYRKALEVGIQHPTTAPNSPDIVKAVLSNKINSTSPQDIIKSADKALTVTYNENPASTPDPGTDIFPAALPANQAAAVAMTLNDFVAQMQGKHSTAQWNYGTATTPVTMVDPTYNPIPPPSTYKQPPYYFLASAGSRYSQSYVPKPIAGSPNPYPPAGEPVFSQPSSGVMHLPMATSVSIWMNNLQAPLSIVPGLNLVNQFGFSPIFIDTSTPQNAAEDVLTTDQYFYQPHEKTAPDSAYPNYFPGIQNLSGVYKSSYVGQNQYDVDAQYTLDSRVLEQTPNTDTNEIVLQLNDAAVNGTYTVQSYFTSKTQSTDTAHYPIPFYRLSNLKLQNEDFDTSSAPKLNRVGTGITIDINAYVYAQEGGWYVIPGTDFDANVKNGDDLNRDGVVSQGESVAAYRYRRYNYQIVFTGAIMENQTASASDVADWADKWATVKMTVPTITPTYDSADPSTSNFNGIMYFYDPSAVQGAVDADVGFHAPVSAGLIYQG